MADTEVMDEIAQDKLFYAQSGGGVTFTGGEVFCQKVFLDSLLDLCRVGGISTAVETNINFLFNEIKAILKKIDVLMVDIKMTDPVKHKTYTLAENNTILENIRRLNGINTKIIVRTPVIPGINDIPEEIIRIAAAAQKLDNLLYYELLNYNPLGHDKYTAMGISRGMLKKKPLSGTAMTALVRAAESTGIKARFA
jgi:pyruvate formate lyase activating enzyme